MQTTSALYKRILSNQNHWFETKLLIVGVGEFDETQLFSISTNIEMFQNSPTIGTASAGEIEVKMLNPAEPIPTMATLIPYVRAVGFAPTGGSAEIDDGIPTVDNATISNGILTFAPDTATLEDDIIVFATTQYEYAESEWIQQGVYFVDTREVIKSDSGEDVLSIHGYDAMLKAEQNYPSSNHGWPYKDTSVVAEIAAAIGITVDTRTNNYLTAGNMIDLPIGYTMREVLERIAGMNCGSFVMSPIGELLFVPLFGFDYEVTGSYLADESNNALVFGNEGWCILV